MATIAALRCRDGVVVAGDRLVVRGGSVASRDRPHLLDLTPDVGAAAVGRDIDRFADLLGSELRSYRFERDAVSLAALERLAGDVAQETEVEAIVATHDEEGRAALRAVSTDGSTLSDPPMAFGSGTSLVLGGLELEAADSETLSLSEAETLVREAFESAAERDPGTGGAVDVWRLADADGAENEDGSAD
jgi:proteasome beta subunit